MSTQNATDALIQPPAGPTNPLIQPPAALLTEVTDPTTNQPNAAFPLQTNTWVKMQDVVAKALAFPLSSANFTDLYGTFSDEGTVETALAVLGKIQTTAAKYGDPQTLISSLQEFENAEEPPKSIYGYAVWLASRTEFTAQQIASLLTNGLTDIENEPDPQKRLTYLTELLTDTKSGVNSYAIALKDDITGFRGVVSAFYDELNPELTGPNDSLQACLNQKDNVYTGAQNAVSGDQAQIEQLNENIKKLNDEYIGFTVAASVSPVLMVIPFYGILLAIADATTFGVLATQVKNELDAARSSLSSASEDEQKKAALVAQLGGFNKVAADVETDGQEFLEAIKTLIGGWQEFSDQIKDRLAALTADDLKNWSDFMTELGFQTALDGWNKIARTAEAFYFAGFARFSNDTPSWLAEGGEPR